MDLNRWTRGEGGIWTLGGVDELVDWTRGVVGPEEVSVERDFFDERKYKI